MQIKKRYFVVVLVLLLGLTTFSFANPSEKMESKKTAKGISQTVTNEKKEEHSYSEALEAVEEAEENPTIETVETARNEIRNAQNVTENQVQNLEQRVEVVEQTIDVAALVKEIETLAEVKETRESAKEKYPNAETAVNNLTDGEIKENLRARLTIVSRFLNDTQAPKITGVTNGSVVNKSENIYVTDEFLFNVKITGPNSKGEVITKEFTGETFNASENNETYTLKYKANYEGKWTVVATDKLGNTTTETFTIDRTKAKRVYSTVRVNKTEYEENKTKYYYVKNGDSFEFAISFSELLASVPTVTIGGRNLEMKLNEKVYKNENKVLYEGTFTIPANEKELKQGTLEIKVSNVKDLAGNESTEETIVNQTKTSNGRTVVYDCKNPVVSGVNNNYYYNKLITITAVDYIVHNVSPIETVTIDGNPYELGTEYEEEGTHQFVAYDRAGNRLRATFTIDMTKPEFISQQGYNESGTNPYIKVKDTTELTFKIYRKGTEKPIHEFSGNTCGNTFTMGWHGGGIYTIVVSDKAGNETSKVIEVYHMIDSTEDLEKAFKNGGKAFITENISITKLVEIPEGVELEIDLNGNELKLVHQDGDASHLISNNGKLTIKNGVLKSEEETAKTLIKNEKNAELILDSIEYIDKAATNSSSIINKGNMTVLNSKITGQAKTNGNTLFNNAGDFTLKNTEIKANSVKGYAANIWSGTVIIDDSNLDTERGGLAILGGNVTINNTNIDAAVGGTNYRALYITDNQEGVDVNVTVNDGKFIGYRDCVYVGHNDLANIKVTINGGEYDLNKGTRNEELFKVVPKSGANKSLDVSIKGGLFKFKTLGQVDKYIAKGYRRNKENRVVKENAISTKQEMIDAIENGGKYELDTNLMLTDELLTVKSGKEVEINLNGKTITGRSTNASASKIIEVTTGGTLKLTGEGTIDFTAGKPDTNWGGEGQPQYPGYASNTIVNRGTLIVDGPTIINNTGKGGASYVIDNYPGANLTIENGLIYQKGGDQAIRVFANSGAEKSVNITVNGGEIKGNRAIWVQLPSNNNTAPVVNLTVNGGKLISTDSTYYYAIYTWTAGQSGKNITATFNGGEVSGYTVFAAYKNDTDKEKVVLNGTKFNDYVGRWTGSAWADI